MEKMLKHSLGYVISMVVILVLIASYFILKMGDSLNAGQDIEGQLKRDNKALLKQSENLTARITQLENHVLELQETIVQKQDSIAEIQNNIVNTDLQGQCDSMTSSEALTTLQSELEAVRIEGDECATALSKKIVDFETFQFEYEKLTKTNNELQETKSAMKELRKKLTLAQQKNQRLLQTNNDEATDLNVEIVQQLESQLIQSKQDVLRLQAQVAKLQAENQEREATTRSTGELEIIEFQATPKFCDTEFSANKICLLAIDITVKFNFSPNGFVTMLAVEPNGETIGRELIAGRIVNQVTFKLDENQPASEGEYHIELKMKDVFNRFSNTQSFIISAP